MRAGATGLAIADPACAIVLHAQVPAPPPPHSTAAACCFAALSFVWLLHRRFNPHRHPCFCAPAAAQAVAQAGGAVSYTKMGPWASPQQAGAALALH